MNALGIDAGGSSTAWVVVGPAGEALASGRAAALSGHLYDSGSRTRALDTINALRVSLASFAPGMALAGVTGLTTGSEQALWLERAIAERLGVQRCAVIGDLDLAYRAHYRPGAGIVLYAGTGSIAYHITTALEVRRAGGRGYRIDDAGGGFWIGQRALRHTMRMLDAGLPTDDPLSHAVLAHVGSSDWEDIRAFVYASDRSAVSGLAPLVGLAAQQGSLEARAILERAGIELANVARRLQRQLGAGHAALPVTAVGGAWLVSPLIANAARATGLKFAGSAVDLALAAARMALELHCAA